MKIARHMCAAAAVAWTGLACLGPAAETPSFPQEHLDFFETRVRPVLAERCYGCHGPDLQRADLRLDAREAILRGSDSGPVVEPGNPEASRLLAVIAYDGKIQMPPDGKLSDHDIEALTHWVALGAPWPAEAPPPMATFEGRLEHAREHHWAFKPVADPPVPSLAAAEWVRTPVDAFIYEQLTARELTPSPEADKATLLRRVSFDLTGLPPTPEEMEAFLADDSPDAYEQVVERLLASPHYGERWARHWLDVARYADTKGYVFQEERSFGFSHTYRDYVIRAFNDDLPYDRFIQEQIAADLVDNGDNREPLAAMGFLTLGRRFIGNIHDITDDRIDVVTRGFLGLTVSCARCHDHKYDPVSIEDYYAMYGIFRSTREPGEMPLLREPDPEDPQHQAFLAELAEREARTEEILDELHLDLLRHSREKIADYLRTAQEAMELSNESEPFRTLAKKRDLRWQLVDRWRQFLGAQAEANDAEFSLWRGYAALDPETFAEEAPGVLEAVQAEHAVNEHIAAAFAEVPPTSLEEAAQRYAAIIGNADAAWREHLSLRAQQGASAEGDTLTDAALEALRQIVYAASGPANVPRDRVYNLSDVPTQDRVRQRRLAVDRLKATHPGRPDRAVSLEEGPLFDPFVFRRGQPGLRGDDVPRRNLALFEPELEPYTESSGRLELAQSIASPENPLTARVMVNRVWMHHFGAPLVGTPSDFGLRSEPPTHPELLDHLAMRFVESGWSVKELHRIIVLSATYRQSSEARAEALAIDPENAMLWRQNRRRLDFEAFRDSLLVASGALDTTLFGESVDITQEPFPTRRTVYSYIERQNLPALFRTFDFATPDAHSPRRYQTTVPQQALFMMNSPFIVEQARTLARRETILAREQPAERIQALYETLFQRAPEDDELALGLAFVSEGFPETPAVTEWQYGHGAIDEDTGAVTAFSRFEFYGYDNWRASNEHPDPNLGWLTLSATGGHPGEGPDSVVIRRWVAPANGTISVEGQLRHAQEQGDGVIGTIVSSRKGLLRRRDVYNAEHDLRLRAYPVEQGEIIDFVVASGPTQSYDSFRWAPIITYIDMEREVEERRFASMPPRTEWNAETDFAGPPPAPLEPWEQYAQVLLMTNEFAFVD